ncbi:MAG: hypothetical protein KKC26_00945, partial [Nanoarchaeota archaeon]|nr:hypothetical protein [Nanoarchaeota archaeon]
EHLFKKRQKSPQIQKKLVINNKTVYLAVHFNLDWAYFRGNLKNKISDCMNSSSYNDSEKEILNGLNKLSFEEILQLILNMYVNTILLTLKKNDSLLRASKVNLYILLADSSGRSGAFTKAVSNFSNYFITYVVDITDFLSYYSLKMSYFTGSVYTTIGHELIHACDWQLSLEQPNSYLIATKLIGSNPSNELILLVNLLCNLRSEGFAEVGSIITEWVSKKRLQSYDLSFSINTFFNKNGEKIKNFFDTNSLNNNFENLKVVSKQFYEAGALHYFGEAIVYLMLINYLRDELVYYNDYLNKTIISSINKESVESIVSGMTRVGYKNRVLFNDLKNCLSSATDLHLLMPISAYSKANIFLKKLSLMNIIVFLKTFISACKTLELSYYPFTVNVLNELDSAAKKKRKAFLKKEGFDE